MTTVPGSNSGISTFSDNHLVSRDLKANTRIVAEKLGKRHDNVLLAINNLRTEKPDWGLLNFLEAPDVDPQNGQTLPMHEMTEGGFSMLVMGSPAGRHWTGRSCATIPSW